MKPCRHTDHVAGCRVCFLALHDARYRERWGIEGDPEPLSDGSEFKPAELAPLDPGLGDEVEAAIKLVGLDRLAKLYEEVTGRSCGCAGRKAKLNRLPGIRAVVRRVLGGDQGGSTSMD